ncbi:MAG: SCO family protein [Acidobacteriaceae bacterium]
MQRKGTIRFLLAAAMLLPAAAPVFAQVAPYGEKTMGDPAQDHLPDILNTVKIDQRLGQQLPLDATFRDETGKAVKLGDYFGKKPVILSLVYYQCQILCMEDLNGLVGALEMVNLTPGKDFQIVIASIDPAETPAMAAAKKAFYVKRYGRPETEAGWHFLTGGQSDITALAKAVGWGYVRLPQPDGKPPMFAHASSIEVVTPEGRMAQYYLGVEYAPRDLQLGLVEASHNTIGTPVDNILTYCYRYDPKLNRHSLVIARVVQAGCLLTFLGLGSFMLVSFRRDFKGKG